MDETTKKELTSNDGKLIELADYDIRVIFDDVNRSIISVNFYKKAKDNYKNHIGKFSDEDIEVLLNDLKDLSDWRHYRRLKAKIESPRD